jgi:predicted N-formylglutamate amidohydrolase
MEPIAGAAAFEILPGERAGGLLILVDHASNAVPPEYADLGLPRSELERHIGYDIGAAALSRALSERLRAPATLTCFSRLLIDPNRGEDDPTLVMRLSDGAVIPGNARIGATEVFARVERFYRPYHAAVSAEIDAMLATGRPPAILAIHSFTPSWKGTRRPWHAGVLWDRDPRIAVPLMQWLGREAGLRIGDNEPYLGALRHDTMHRHATMRGLPHALLEVRNDLIASPSGVAEWSDRLEPVLRAILAEHGLHEVRHYGSLTDDETDRHGGFDAHA